jgi:hypothetical protein
MKLEDLSDFKSNDEVALISQYGIITNMDKSDQRNTTETPETDFIRELIFDRIAKAIQWRKCEVMLDPPKVNLDLYLKAYTQLD